MAVINGGRIVAEGTPSSLKAATAEHTVIAIEATGVDDTVVRRVRETAGVASVVVEQGTESQTVLVQSTLGAQLIQPLLARLDGVTVTSVTAREPTLEDVYVELVGRT